MINIERKNDLLGFKATPALPGRRQIFCYHLNRTLVGEWNPGSCKGLSIDRVLADNRQQQEQWDDYICINTNNGIRDYPSRIRENPNLLRYFSKLKISTHGRVVCNFKVQGC